MGPDAAAKTEIGRGELTPAVHVAGHLEVDGGLGAIQEEKNAEVALPCGQRTQLPTQLVVVGIAPELKRRPRREAEKIRLTPAITRLVQPFSGVQADRYAALGVHVAKVMQRVRVGRVASQPAVAEFGRHGRRLADQLGASVVVP